jgi:hypothetical protein
VAEEEFQVVNPQRLVDEPEKPYSRKSKYSTSAGPPARSARGL